MVGGCGGGGFVFLALPACLPHCDVLVFFTQKKGGAGPSDPSLDPPLVLITVESFTRSAEASSTCRVKFRLKNVLLFLKKVLYSKTWAFLTGGFMGEFREKRSFSAIQELL